MGRLRATLDTSCTYEVVGERFVNPTHLLVIGNDDNFCTLDLVDGHTTWTELTDEWIIDTCDLRDKLTLMALT